jgi:4-hydroxy-tetrahydrodipicolinate synthase
VTPIRASGELDEAALQRVIERVLKGGAHGIFALGTMGEGPSLSRHMRARVVRLAADTIGGRVPLYVGVTQPSIDDTVYEALHYREVGADVLVSVCPYYLPIDAREIMLYFERLAEATGGPIMLYDIPSMTKVTFHPDVVEELSRDDRFIGYKDSRNNAEALWGLLQRFAGRDDFAIFVGVESLLPEAVLFGGAGGVCGGGNVWPELFVAVYEAARARDLQALERVRAQLIEFIKFYPLYGHASTMIGGVKTALELLGVCERWLLPPMIGSDDKQVARVKETLTKMGLL